MLEREDFENGHNLNNQQRDSYNELKRPGFDRILKGQVRRPFFGIAFMPAPDRIEEEGAATYKSWRFTQQEPFVRSDRVDVVLLHDQPLRKRIKDRGIRISATIQKAFLDGGGVPSVGGVKQFCLMAADFANGPRFPGQAALECSRVTGGIQSPVDGDMSVSVCGDNVDVLIGDLPVASRHKRALPAIALRFHRSDLIGERPAVTIEGLETLPESGTSEIGPVVRGAVVAKAARPVSYYAAHYENGVPVMEKHSPDIFPAQRFQQLSVVNRLQRMLSDYTLLPDTDPNRRFSVPPTDTWAPRAMVAFDRSYRPDPTDPDQNILVDPKNLTTLPGFTVTQALREDLLAALGPSGRLYAKAEVSGIIRDIGTVAGQENLIQIVYDDGSIQHVPSCARLRKELPDGTSKPLEAGDSVRPRERIGDLVQRMHYESWQRLVDYCDSNIDWLISLFMQDVAVYPGQQGWTGASTLFDSRYVLSVLDFATLDQQDRPLWYWDLKRTMRHVSHETGALIVPPVRYDWDLPDVAIGGVQFFLGSPYDANKLLCAAKRRDRRRRQRKQHRHDKVSV